MGWLTLLTLCLFYGFRPRFLVSVIVKRSTIRPDTSIGRLSCRIGESKSLLANETEPDKTYLLKVPIHMLSLYKGFRFVLIADVGFPFLSSLRPVKACDGTETSSTGFRVWGLGFRRSMHMSLGYNATSIVTYCWKPGQVSV